MSSNNSQGGKTMRVPFSWLQEYVPDVPTDMDALESLLSMSGTKVEAVHQMGVPQAGNGNGAGFRVGRVVSFEQHPNADRLRLCRVDVGEGEPRQIVCGASNFQEGDTVAVVLPGARMPGGFEITTAKLRGVESHGMMLSERELELSTDHAGIMILPGDLTPGTALADVVPLGDTIFELEITPNRPDCLGVMGVAREVAAVVDAPLYDGVLRGDADATAPGSVQDHIAVQVDAPDLCPRYMARAFVDVQIQPSPLWLRARLAAAGMRAINNVVDITNYVMLLTGQPLHAFDADKISGQQIIVRRAVDNEQVTTLDGVERTLEPWMLSIADASRTAVIAGIMGAADVEVADDTTRIVLESANFHGPTIQRSSMRLGLRSESSARFEKGLDAHLPDVALRIASRMLVELCGAKMVPGTIDVTAPDGIPAAPVVTLSHDYAPSVLGADVSVDEQSRILTALGYDLTVDGDAWNVGVPHWRMFDTTRPIDVVEEIGRVYGLDRIPSTLPARRDALGVLTPWQQMQRTLENTAASLGLHEAYTYALVATGSGATAGVSAADVVRVANPMAAEQGELRSTLVLSHLDAVRRNQSMGVEDVALFEIGRTFAAGTGDGADGLPRFVRERRVLSICCAGALHGGSLSIAPIRADFGAAAGYVASLAQSVGVRVQFERMEDAALQSFHHPGQSAQIVADGVQIGWVATVHPGVARSADIKGDVVAAEIDLDALGSVLPAAAIYAPISTYPPVNLDLAFVLANSVEAGAVIAAVRDAAGDLLASVDVFDRYAGEHIEPGYHSLALRLVFRALDRTLGDEDVSAAQTAIVARMATEFSAALRE